MAVSKGDALIYVVGCGLGMGAGMVDLRLADLLVTSLLVLASTMLLGILRPEKPWRWIPLVAAFVPAVELFGYLFLKVKPYRAQFYESLLGFLTGAAGAYGGSVLRSGARELFRPQSGQD